MTTVAARRTVRRDRRVRPADGFFAELATPALVLDARGVVCDANPAFQQLAGRTRERLVGTPITALMLPEERALTRRMARAFRRGDAESLSAELRLRGADGTARWVEVTASRRSGGLPGDAAFYVLVRDVDGEARRLAALAADLAQDSATGAASLEALRTRAVRAFVPGRSVGETALVVIEVARLAALGTVHGAPVADAVLAVLSARLQAATRGSDVVARVAADRFGVLLTGMARADDVRVVVERMRRAGLAPITVGTTTVSLALRLVVVPALDAADADDLLARGFSAAQASRFSEAAPRRGRAGRFAIEAGLRRLLADPASAGRELWLAYQPVVALDTGALVAVEALCRWDDPAFGSISPGQFVPVAEAAGLDLALGEWVVRTACAQLGEWRRHSPGAAGLALHVNLSAGQLGDPHLPRLVTAAAEAAGIPLDALVLEVTETALALHPDHAAGPLATLRATGVRLALDDFGTGYSSLAALSRLPLDMLKVDRRFVADLREPGRPAELARLVLGLGSTLQLATVAEGIEDAADAARVAALLPGAQGQGWHHGRPARGDAIARLLDGPVARSDAA